MIDRLDVLQRVRISRHVELGCPQGSRLCLFPRRSGKDDHFAAHFRRELDREVSQPPDTYDTHAVRRAHPMHLHRAKHRRARAHQGCCLRRGDSVGDVEQEGSLPDGMRAKASLVLVALRVYLALCAKDLVAG